MADQNCTDSQAPGKHKNKKLPFQGCTTICTVLAYQFNEWFTVVLLNTTVKEALSLLMLCALVFIFTSSSAQPV